MVMVQRLSKLSAVRGIIDRRILANYRIDPGVAATQLPAPFEPKLVNGYGIGGLCLIRLKRIRPRLLPLRVGIDSENAAHRIAVMWESNGEQCEGVYIPRRDTNSAINAIVGGRIFPGEHHRARFEVKETEQSFDVGFTSRDGQCSMRIQARLTNNFPTGSVFADLNASSDFFEAGALGYSATRQGGRYDGLELSCRSWSVQPLAIDSVASSFFDNQTRFPQGSISFDHALLMRGIEHQWHQRGVMRCDTNPT